MNANPLLADPAAIRLEHIVSQPTSLVIVVTAVRRQAGCPKCRRISTRVHSHYQRTVADLPWQGVSVRLELHTRRFRCLNDLCERSIFCERMPSVVAHYARQTARLTSALELIGFAIGGEAGARVARELAMATSPDTLLRRIRQAIPEAHPTPRILGVDDWAFRRGHRYGTILVDLERRCPVDLLPDREAGTLATWLRAHPGVEVVSRDRACAYADGVVQGAPAAVQVADRWHLMKNMGDAVQRLLERKHAVLRQAAKAVTTITPAPMAQDSSSVLTPAPLPTLSEQARQHSRERRLARYHEVITLREQGTGVRAISRQLHLSRMTVRKLLRAGSFPEQAQRSRCQHDFRVDPVTSAKS
jgi:transposase